MSQRVLRDPTSDLLRRPPPPTRGGGLARQRRSGTRRPVSRVLCRLLAQTRRPFLWTAPRGTVLATYPDGSGRRGPAPDRSGARRPYSVLLQAGLAMPVPSPVPRCALTAPFHPYPASAEALEGGLLSVALSLGLPPPDVIRRRVSMEPGLSSADAAAVQPTGMAPDMGIGACGQQVCH